MQRCWRRGDFKNLTWFAVQGPRIMESATSALWRMM
jgi:hypothetical protein